jgi:hypothetical protein
MARFQVIDSCAGMPRLSLTTRLVSPRVQSAESQMMWPADSTTTWRFSGAVSKEHVPDAVETA